MQGAHSDLWRPNDLVSIRGNRYFIDIINDNIRKIWTYSVTSKDIFFSFFKMWKKDIKTKIKLKLSNLQIDGRSEYVSFILKKFCEEKEVVIEFTSTYTSE